MNNQELIKIFNDFFLMVQEKAFVIAVIIGISLIISTVSLLSLPMNAEHDEWWSYNTMREKMINSEDETSDFTEMDENLKSNTDEI